MTHKLYFMLGLLAVLGLSSCEDVIDLDLNTTEPQLVIEAVLDAGSNTANVSLTQTSDFYDNGQPNGVSGAMITLEGETGKLYTLTEETAGHYTANGVEVLADELFVLRVDLEGITYEASARVPLPVPLDKIEASEFGSRPFGDDDGTIQLMAEWDDPSGVTNYYRVRSYVDGTIESGNYVLLVDDFIGDGSLFNIPLMSLYEENTSVTLELLSTDKQYYDYFFQVSSVVGDGNNATTPYNPKGNFDQDALGYFGIYYASSQTIEL